MQKGVFWRKGRSSHRLSIRVWARDGETHSWFQQGSAREWMVGERDSRGFSIFNYDDSFLWYCAFKLHWSDWKLEIDLRTPQLSFKKNIFEICSKSTSILDSLPYLPYVMLWDACPSNSEATCSFTPTCFNSFAKVCLREWKLFLFVLTQISGSHLTLKNLLTFLI